MSSFRRTTHLFTSESVTMGHPDKVADQISDAIVDAIFAEEGRLEKEGKGSLLNTRVACETLVTTGQVVIAGEVRTNAYIDAAEIARQTIKEIGYTHADIGFDSTSCGVPFALSVKAAPAWHAWQPRSRKIARPATPSAVSPPCAVRKGERSNAPRLAT